MCLAARGAAVEGLVVRSQSGHIMRGRVYS